MTEARTVALETGLTVSFVERGDPGAACVVLLPGPTDSWRSYEPVLERLPVSIRAVAVSQRGHGDSDKPPSGYRVENFAGDVIALLDGLGIERAVLGGHSASCLTARRVALDEPGRVAGLILESSPLTLRDDAGLARFVKSAVSCLEDPIAPDFVRSFVVETSSEGISAATLDRLVEEALKVPAGVWREMFTGLLSYDDLVELASIGAPTLLIWGDADPLVTRTMQDELHQRLCTAELVVYGGVGHTPRWEDPARFASDVAGFVNRTLPAPG